MKKYIMYCSILLIYTSHIHAWSLIDSCFDLFSTFVLKAKKAKKVNQSTAPGVQNIPQNQYTPAIDFNVSAIPAGSCYEAEVFPDQVITVSYNSLIFSELYKNASINFGKNLSHITNNNTSKTFFIPYYEGKLFGIECIESMLPSKKILL